MWPTPPSTGARNESIGQEANWVLQFIFNCKRHPGPALQNVNKTSLVSLSSAAVIKNGNMISGIDHSLCSHNISPCFPDNFTFKVGKMELCDPLDLSPLPYWQAPLILELRPHLLNSRAHLESPTNQWQSELQSISPNIFPSFPQPDSTFYLLGKTGSYGEGTCLCRK